MSAPDGGDPGGGDGIAPDPLAVDPFDDGTLDTPNCPACLHRMEAASTAAGTAYWSCPSCGQTRLT
jgi:tRNA(Ile2) C34 agmatinyltransferase TiaS